MKLARPATAVIVGWTVVLLLIAAFVSVLLNDRWQNAQALPLMFWTLYSGLVLVAVACAIGLPSEKAAFWRTWVLTLAACVIGFNSSSGLLGRFPLPREVRAWLRDWQVDDRWAFSVLVATVYATVALLAGTLAIALRRRSVTSQHVFRFRLFHMLLLMTAVALSCWAILHAERHVRLSCVLVVWAAKIVAAVMLGARRGHACFLAGFLAGIYGLVLLVGQSGVVNEWLSVFGVTNKSFAPFLLPNWHLVVYELMPFYAGLLTGVLAAMLYRPPAQPTAQEAQRFDT